MTTPPDVTAAILRLWRDCPEAQPDELIHADTRFWLDYPKGEEVCKLSDAHAHAIVRDHLIGLMLAKDWSVRMSANSLAITREVKPGVGDGVILTEGNQTLNVIEAYRHVAGCMEK